MHDTHASILSLALFKNLESCVNIVDPYIAQRSRQETMNKYLQSLTMAPLGTLMKFRQWNSRSRTSFISSAFFVFLTGSQIFFSVQWLERWQVAFGIMHMPFTLLFSTPLYASISSFLRLYTFLYAFIRPFWRAPSWRQFQMGDNWRFDTLTKPQRQSV